MPNRSLPLTCSIIASLATLSAQNVAPQPDAIEARAFLPEAYTMTMRADMGAIADSGLWDAVERSMLRTFLGGFRDRFGFDLVDASRITYGGRVVPGEDRDRRIDAWVFEGGERVSLSNAAAAWLERKSEETTNGVTWWSESPGDSFASPRPGLLVIADADHLRRVLGGDRRGGVPDDELLALMAVRDSPFVIAQVLPAAADADERLGLDPMPADWFTDDDKPVAARIRLEHLTDEDAVTLECLLRFENGDRGPARLVEQLFAWRDGLAARGAPWAGIAPYLAKLEQRTDGRDAIVRLPLGTAERAGATLASFVGTMMPVVLGVGSAPEPVVVPMDPAGGK